LVTRSAGPSAYPAADPAADLDDEIRDVARDAHRILAMTDGGQDPSFTRTRSAAIHLAAQIGAELILYDHAAESHFMDPYLGGSVAADIREAHGEELLDERQVRTVGRAYLAEQIHEAAETGVRARAWLPLHTGARGLAEGVTRFSADLVVVPDGVGPTSMIDKVLRKPADWLTASLTVPALVVGEDGVLHLAAGWRLDVARSAVSFTARQLGVLPVHGYFPDFAIELQFDEDDPTRSSVFAVIQAASVTTGLAMRDGQLRGRGFLDVERFPELRYSSFRIEQVEDPNRMENAYRIEGDLEIKGFARLVDLDARIMGPEDTPEGLRRVRFRAMTDIDWREWGIHGRWFVAPGLRVEIDVTATAPAPTETDPKRYVARTGPR
jgi:polyisoprenoid-binding protein YceI